MMEFLRRLLLPRRHEIENPDDDRRRNRRANRRAALEARRLRHVIQRRPEPLLRDFEDLVRRLDHR
jgi:hypothetical protein